MKKLSRIDGKNRILWWITSMATFRVRTIDKMDEDCTNHQRRMIEWCLCDTAAATASWISLDVDRFLERTASGNWFRGDSSRVGGKQQPARCSRKTQDKFAIASMAKKLLHCCKGAHARVHVIFLRRVCMHFNRCCEHHACADVYVKQVLWTSAHTFAYTLATEFAYALMYVQFVPSALGNETGGVQLVYEGTCCLA